MRRRSLALATVVVVVLSGSSALAGDLPRGGSFWDDDLHIAEGAIEAIAADGITKGCNPPANTIFCPDDTVTRGQMAAFLARAFDLPDSSTDYFEDDDGSTFEFAINKVAEAGITKGCNPPDNTEYCPDGFVTRGQMAAFLVRAFGYSDDGGGGKFTDTSGHLFESAIDKLAEAGVTKGCNPPANDRFCPDSLVKRSQMASFLARALKLTPMTPPIGFIGEFEGFDPPPDSSHITLTVGPTGSDHKVDVNVFDDGATLCLNRFGEFSPATLNATGTRINETHIDVTFPSAVCHLSSGDKTTAGPFAGIYEYEPLADVIRAGPDAVCRWRSDGGNEADC